MRCNLLRYTRIPPWMRQFSMWNNARARESEGKGRRNCADTRALLFSLRDFGPNGSNTVMSHFDIGWQMQATAASPASY